MLGANRCISSAECAMIGPDCCKRLVSVFVNEIGPIGAPTVFGSDFLYGDAFCGRMATAGTEIKKKKLIFCG